MTEKLEKLKQGYTNLSEWLEHIMAAIVLIAIVIAIASLWEPFKEFLHTRTESGSFLEYMASVFDIVIGIEFFKLLCKPRKDTMLVDKEIAELKDKEHDFRAKWEGEKTLVNKIQQDKQEIENLKFEAERMEREGNYERVAEIRYSKLVALEE